MEFTSQPPLEEYGAIGDLETVALVSRHGSIDWCPLPHMESPSVFAAILDAERGGHFSITPVTPHQSAQRYRDRTNVLSTDFYTSSGRGTLTDWMEFPDPGETDPPDVLYRKLTCTHGTVEFDIEFAPRHDYARTVPTFTETNTGVTTEGAGTTLSLSAPMSFTIDGATAKTTTSLHKGETVWFVLRYGHEGPHDPKRFDRRLDDTLAGWRNWVRSGNHESWDIDDDRWHDLVVRSALVLKLLTHRESGAIAAAPTTSLPEEIGGTRNWDYRFNWIRDAAFTVQALHKLGHDDEANSYFSWLLSRVYEDPESIRPLYALHGGTDTTEQILEHLKGYRGSAPVRIGNAAHDQLQLDIYGELVLAMFETSRMGETITESDWNALKEIIEHVDKVWDQPDAGIWEVRTEPRHFVHSKVMCWTALDRGIQIVEDTEFDGPLDRWRDTRAEIRDAILTRGYDDDLGSFLQTFETDTALDASTLLIPLVDFLPSDDERVQGTIDAVQDRLTTDQGLVYRYDGDDGLPGGEGTFVLCTCWLVDALAVSGRINEATTLFDNVLSHASPLGLFAEEISAETGALLGNFPQAFSHLGVVNSALYLDQARQDRQKGPDPIGTEDRQSEELSTDPDR